MPESQHRSCNGGACCELGLCTLDKLARVAYDTANETHRNGVLLAEINTSLASLVEMYRGVHPDQVVQLDRLARLEAKCSCRVPEKPHDSYTYEPCEAGRTPGHGGSDGWSVKAVAVVESQPIEERHPEWTITQRKPNESDENLPQVGVGPFVRHATPSKQTPVPMDFRSGSGPIPGGAQQPVTFRTFTNGSIVGGWPPDMSGAKSGDVVLMSGNLWLKLSVDGGKSFTDIDFTKVFAADATYGGWGTDQVVHYVPEIDRFVLYVQSYKGTGANANKNVVKVALASPADLKKYEGAKPAWSHQWHFTSDTFGIGAWLDFPDLSYGAGYLYITTNTFASTPASIAAGKTDPYVGKLFFELPLAQLKVGGLLPCSFGFLTGVSAGSPTQNIGEENYWATHVDNSTIRIYSSKGADPNYSWRNRSLLSNWPVTPKDSAGQADIVSKPPDAADWISVEDNRIIGATKVNNQLWFAWAAAAGTGSGGGFTFPQAHIQIAKVDLAQDYKVVDQMQVWNASYAFSYPSLTTNSNNEVGISCAWGGGGNYGSHVVGIIGDFVLWYGEASDKTAAGVRFGDYVHVRLAHPDTRFFSGFGYAVRKAPPAGEKDEYLYVEFGREAIPASPLH